MNTDSLISSFRKIGAEAEVRNVSPFGFRFSPKYFSVDIDRSRRQEKFVFDVGDGVDIAVVDLQPREQHLLIMVRGLERRHRLNPKFLCGHDERYFFTAAIPESAGATTVRTAMQALKPAELVHLEAVRGVKPQHLHSRRRKLRTGGKIFRQGEFMFVPDPDFLPKVPLAIMHDEILARPGLFRSQMYSGNPHTAKELYRELGEQVYVCQQFPNGLNERERNKLFTKNREASRWYWETRVRNPKVHVRGTIRHPEHATIHLGRIWHRVYLNTEYLALAMSHVHFID